jgi:RNA polymerase sigma factor (sigma-70 family)
MNPAPPADAELVARVQGGEVDAYAVLIKRYQAQATGLAALVMGDPSEAEDIAQEAFIKAYYALDRFKPDASFRAWLIRIVANEARNFRAAAQRRAGLHTRFGEDFWRGSIAPSAEESAVTNEQRSALLTALDGLREDDRAVLMYRYVFDLNEAEMAEALGCSPGTVKSRLSRSLSRLRKDLTRVAPLLFVTPDFHTLVGQTLSGAATPASSRSPDLAAAVLHRLAAGAPPSAHSGGGGGGRPSPQQAIAGGFGVAVVVALAATGMLLSVSGGRETPVPTLEPTQAPSPPAATAALTAASPTVPAVVVAYGGDLTDSQRQEVSQMFGAGFATSTETVSHDELVSGLEEAGFQVDSSERAISSALVECLNFGDGLRVRTENITQLPAAAYANALVTAGIDDASVTVAAPPSAPMTGETALFGVLKAYPHCHAGQQAQPARVRLAYDQLRATAAMGEASGAWDRAAAVMLRSAQAAITAGTPDEVMLGNVLDQAAAAEGLALDAVRRSEVISVLVRVAQIDHGPYAQGYSIQQIASNDVKVLPLGATVR